MLPLALFAVLAAAVSPELVARVAERYYEAVALDAGPTTPPAPSRTLAVRVVDRRLRPIAGATLVATPWSKEARLGAGTTDADGRATLALTEESGEVCLEVTAPGHARWAMTGVRTGRTVALARELAAVRADVATATDPEERLWLALEAAGAPGLSSDEETIYPAIGALRPELRALAATPAFAREDVGRLSPALRAQRLLALWADPEDEALVATWAKAHTARTPRGVTGATLAALCAAFADRHFEAEKVTTRTYNACDRDPPMAPDGSRALLTFRVQYAHWAYDIHLAARKDGDTWRLVHALEGATYHFD